MSDQAPSQFWAWSLKHYQKKGVSTTLLRLQDDAGLNVNLLLWCVWSAHDFEEISDLVLRKAHDLTSRWSAGLTANLRQVRRALKSPPRQADAEKARTLRERVKKAELEAEEIEQLMLETLAQDNLMKTDSSKNVQTRTRRNLASYAALAGAGKQEGFSVNLLEDLITSIFAETESDTMSCHEQK